VTFREAQLSLQLMAEERVGAPRRAEVAAEVASEDAAYEQSRKAAGAR
jgi:hypothetical protein